MNMYDLVVIVGLIVTLSSVWLRSAVSTSVLFITGSCVSLLIGWVTFEFLISFVALVVAAVGVRFCTSKFLKAVCMVELILISLILGTHSAPGYSVITFLENTQLSAESGWSALAFIADKPLVGLVILFVLWQHKLISSWSEFKQAFTQSLPVIAAGCGVVYALALLLNYVQFDWSPSPLIGYWAVKNLFFTVIAEEALFRGVILMGLLTTFTFRHGRWLALVLSSVLFGLAHIGGGWTYVFLASVAGLFYGGAMMRSGRIEMAILAHITLNTGHILLFTY